MHGSINFSIKSIFFSRENVKKRVIRAVRIAYKRGVLQDDLCLVQGEVEPDDITVSVSVHHLWIWEQKQKNISVKKYKRNI